MNKKHHSNCQCSICGRCRPYTFTFKNGYVCEDCLEYLKEVFRGDRLL